MVAHHVNNGWTEGQTVRRTFCGELKIRTFSTQGYRIGTQKHSDYLRYSQIPTIAILHLYLMRITQQGVNVTIMHHRKKNTLKKTAFT